MPELLDKYNEIITANKELIRENQRTQRLLLILGSILAGIFFIGGVFIAILGTRAMTEFSLFGQTFKSTSAGIALGFIGAVLFILLLRRLLQSTDAIIDGAKDIAGVEGPRMAEPALMRKTRKKR
jgi:hypothetical protein